MDYSTLQDRRTQFVQDTVKQLLIKEFKSETSTRTWQANTESMDDCIIQRMVDCARLAFDKSNAYRPYKIVCGKEVVLVDEHGFSVDGVDYRLNGVVGLGDARVNGIISAVVNSTYSPVPITDEAYHWLLGNTDVIETRYRDA